MNVITKINGKDDFDSFVKDNENIIVKFSASWCGPCRILEETLKNLDAEKISGVVLCEIDVDAENNEELTDRFSIRNIPVLIYLKNGEVVSKSVGAVPSDSIYKEIEEKF